MPALVLFGRRLLIASDDIPLFALPAALFHTFWTVALVTVLLLYSNQPLCTDEGMYLPFLGGAAGAFALSSAIEWALVAVGLRGTPLQAHARGAIVPLLVAHGLVSAAEVAFAAYGSWLLHVDHILCPGWSPRPLAAALVGTSWAVIALNWLLTLIALNPWHGLGLVEAWEARLLMLARLLCCHVGVLTQQQAHLPDKEPALRRIAHLTSTLLGPTDLTLSDVATALLLVAAAQRERRTRALRAAMMAAVTAAARSAAGSPLPAAGAPTRGGALSHPQGRAPAATGAGGSRAGAGRTRFSGDGQGAGAGAGVAGGAGSVAVVEDPLEGLVSSAIAAAAAAVEPLLRAPDPRAPPPAPATGTSPSNRPSPFLAVQWRPRSQSGTPQLPTKSPSPALSSSPAVPPASRGPSPAAPGTGVQQGPAAGPSPVLGGEATGAADAAAAPPPEAGALPPAAGGAPPPPLPAPAAQDTLQTQQGEEEAATEAGVAGAAPGSPDALAPYSPNLAEQLSHSMTLLHPATYITPEGMGYHVHDLVQEIVGELAGPQHAELVAGALGATGGAAAAAVPGGEGVGIAAGGSGPGAGAGSATTTAEAAMAVVAAAADAASVSGTPRAGAVPGAGFGPATGDAAGPATLLASSTTGAGTGAAGAGAGGVAVAAPPGVVQPAALQGAVAPAAAAPGVTAAPAAANPAAAAAAVKLGEVALAAAFAAGREEVESSVLREALIYGRYAAAIYGCTKALRQLLPADRAAWARQGRPPGAAPLSARRAAAAAAAASANRGRSTGGGAPGAGRSGGGGVAAGPRRIRVTSGVGGGGRRPPPGMLTAIVNSASLLTEHVLYVNTHNSAEGYLPYMVCLDPDTRSVVVSIRGTSSAEDIVTDCLCQPYDVRQHPLLPQHLLEECVRAAAAAAGPGVGAGAAAGTVPGHQGSGSLSVSRASSLTLGGAGGAGEQVPGEAPLLVHGGIWAAAEVIMMDLHRHNILTKLLGPPANAPQDLPLPATAAAPAPHAPTTSSPPQPATAPYTTRSARRTPDPHTPPELPEFSRIAMESDTENLPRLTSADPLAARGSSGFWGQLLGIQSTRQQSGITALPPGHPLAPPCCPQAPNPPLSPHQQVSKRAEASRHGWTDAGMEVRGVGYDVGRSRKKGRMGEYGKLQQEDADSLSGSGLDSDASGEQLEPEEGLGRAADDGGMGVGVGHRQLDRGPSLASSSSSSSGVVPGGVRLRTFPPLLFGRRAGQQGPGETAANQPAARPPRPAPVGLPPRQLPTSTYAGAGGAPGGAPVLQSALASHSMAAGREGADDVRWRDRIQAALGEGAAGARDVAAAARAAAAAAARAVGLGLRRGQQPYTRVPGTAEAAPYMYERLEMPRDIESGAAGSAAARGNALGRPEAAGPRISDGGAAATRRRSMSDAEAAEAVPRRTAVAAAGGGAQRWWRRGWAAGRGGGGCGGVMAAPGAAASGAAAGPLQPPDQGRLLPAGPREFDNLVSEHLLPPDQQREREREVLPGPRRAVSLGPGAGPVAGLGQGAGPVWRPPPRGDRARGATGRAGPRQGSGHEELLLGEWGTGRRQQQRFGPVHEEEEQPHEEGGPGLGVGQQQQQAGQGRTSGGGASEEGNRGGGGVVADGDGEDEGRGVQVPYDCSGWRLVVTGHSLGAGAAALLALLLRPSYPNVQCWAFSPPGNLLSPALSRALSPFVVAVVSGKDLIPRLSLNSLERLRDDMVTSLARCRHSKASVLLGSLSRRNRLRRAGRLLLPYNAMPPEARAWLRAYHTAVRGSDARHPELHPPGRVLYLQPSAHLEIYRRHKKHYGATTPQPEPPAGPGGTTPSSRAPTQAGGGAPGLAAADEAMAGLMDEDFDELGPDGRGMQAGGRRRPYRPVWVTPGELMGEGILASTRMLQDHSITLCTLPALIGLVGRGGEAVQAGRSRLRGR